MQTKSIKKINCWLVMGVFLLTGMLHACKKSTEEVTPVQEEESYDSQIVIGVSGIKPNSEAIAQLAKKSSIYPNVDAFEGPVLDVQSDGQGDFLVHTISTQTLEDNAGAWFQNGGIQKYAANLSANRSVSKMDPEVKYRFILYDRNTGYKVGSYLLTAGKLTNIGIRSEIPYRWCAYSYNQQEDIPDPNSSTNTITTPIDKAFLYSTGTIDPIAGKNPLQIVFEHQLTQLEFRINSKRYFGSIVKVETKFNDNYIKTATFDLYNGQPKGNLQPVTINQMKYVIEDQGSTREQVARYYTADHNLTSYQVKVNVLDLQNPNRPVTSLIGQLPNDGVVTFSNFTGNNKGNALKGLLKLWKVLPQKKIMHYGPLDINRGYEAVAGSTSGYFLSSDYNFSPASNYLKINGFSNTEIKSSAGNLAVALANPANYPDILLCGFFGTMNAADFSALETYLKRGGVTFLMTESTNTALRVFFQNILGSTVTTATYDAGGAVYKLENVDPDVTNGAFGDIRGAYWGQDRSASQYILNINPADVVAYTYSSANFVPRDGITMFRHKILNLYFVGDTGFLSSPQKALGGAIASNTGYPFATVGGSKVDKYFPDTKTYGAAAASRAPEAGKRAGSWQVSNSFIFANALSWMLERAEFAPVDRNP